jgi:hypothetical protein
LRGKERSLIVVARSGRGFKACCETNMGSRAVEWPMEHRRGLSSRERDVTDVQDGKSRTLMANHHISFSDSSTATISTALILSFYLCV